MLIYSLCSSSRSGSSYLVIGPNGSLLIDCGSTNRHLKVSLELLGKCLSDLVGCLLTHSHPDHTRSAAFLARNGISLYARQSTAQAMGALRRGQKCVETIQVGCEVCLPGYFSVSAWEVPHYATDNSTAFLICSGDERCAIITDAGSVPTGMVSAIRGATYIVCESNHDEVRAKSGIPFEGGRHRPLWVLRDRSYGPKGHLSNQKAALLLSRVVSPLTRGVLLCHLSEDYNRPDAALKTVRMALGAWDGTVETAAPGWITGPLGGSLRRTSLV